VVGQRIDTIGGVPYITFVFPGILIMNVISSAFSQTSSSLYFQRFARHIEEILVAPLSHLEMILGYIAGALARGVVVGVGIVIIGIFFGAVAMYNVPLFVFYMVMISVVFGLIGLLVGLWSDGFEQLALLNTFVIMPLSFLGGMFNSIDMLPPIMQKVVVWNPFFYFIDGVRYSMTGISESHIGLGMSIIIICSFALGSLVWVLFERGWRLRS
jgi:ABC-2 type transport system permease protein